MSVRADISRRNFLKGEARPAPFRARPPGAIAQSLAACTNCGDCIDACPENVLALAPDGVMLLTDAGECTFCGECEKACPENVFVNSPHMAHVMEISDDCLVYAGIACMSCRDACPEEAIRMQPRIGAPFFPQLDSTACTGCAGCSAACPAGAIHAVEKEADDD